MQKTLENGLYEVKQIALKNRVWMITAIVLSFLFCTCILLFRTQPVKVDITEAAAIERERLAIEQQTKALYQLVDQQSKRINELSKRDSILLNEILGISSYIKK